MISNWKSCSVDRKSPWTAQSQNLRGHRRQKMPPNEEKGAHRRKKKGKGGPPLQQLKLSAAFGASPAVPKVAPKRKADDEAKDEKDEDKEEGPRDRKKSKADVAAEPKPEVVYDLTPLKDSAVSAAAQVCTYQCLCFTIVVEMAGHVSLDNLCPWRPSVHSLQGKESRAERVCPLDHCTSST
jgi:hypothetical protein